MTYINADQLRQARFDGARDAAKIDRHRRPAETTRLGVIPDTSQIQLHADAALNAMADAGLKPADIDGIATAGETPVTVAHYLGLTPKWVDGTAVGGCSFMIHVRHAAAAIASGLCETVLITHGENGHGASETSTQNGEATPFFLRNGPGGTRSPKRDRKHISGYAKKF